ncbi:MAG: GIY-YIG nuclease family protein [Candidatus Pacebacteria bacterium]|nr:GIY-YIG nuclease family protein [Candidatus Paceibacterota bacterium]
MNKQLILDSIKAVAAVNGGAPPGRAKFANETGIKEPNWQKYWPRWGDALQEAGFAPNIFSESFDEAFLLEKLALLAREVGHIPTTGDQRVKSHSTPGFPNSKTFERLGKRNERIARLLAYCQTHDGLNDVAALCEAAIKLEPEKSEPSEKDDFEIGFVYLLKSGRNYKLGRSNAFGRRERELSIQLPDRPDTVHVIKTDDPIGIEAYWHKRFGDKRKNGEWFELNADDVKAFKRRKVFM